MLNFFRQQSMSQTDKFTHYCEYAIFFGLAVFALTVNLSVSICEIGLGIAFLFTVINAVRTGQAPTRPADTKLIAIAWGAFFMAALISATLALNKKIAFAYFPSDLFKCSAFFLFLYTITAQHVRKLANCYIAGAVVAGLYSLYQVIILDFPRAKATVHPVTFGELMMLASTLALCLLLFAKQRRQIVIYSISTIITVPALIASMTRGAYIGFVVFWVVLLIFAGKLRKRAIIVALIISALAGLYIAKHPKILHHVANSVRLHYAETKTIRTKDASLNIRLKLWEVGAEIWKDHPVSGVGQNNVAKVFDTYHPDELGGEKSWGNLHNLYLQHMAERGILGLSALLFLFYALWRFALLQLRRGFNPYSLWAVSMMPGFYIINLPETSFQHALPAFSMLFAVACAAAAPATDAQQSTSDKTAS